MFRKTTTLLFAAALGAPLVNAQFNFNVDNMPVQIHSFGSQGFLYSNDNNYLTTNSSQGSFQDTDLGVNGSIQITDNFRIGAQFYDRNLGELGKWHPQLDWAVADYKFKDWFGIRGGVVKSVFGLFNDTQDMDFLRVFSLLPQGVYPTDLRDAMIRHRGGDIYGAIPLQRLGSICYTAYAGLREDSQYGGYPYMLSGTGGDLTSYGGLQVAEDLRWTTPVKGLLLGASHVGEDITGTGTWTLDFSGPPVTMPYEEHSKRDWTNQFYGQYTLGNLELDAEYKRYWRDQEIFNDTWEVKTDVRSWYGAASYRISKRFSVGSYYSRFTNAWTDSMMGLTEAPSQAAPDRHLYDKVVSARADLTKFWYLKVEGHFMNGYGSPGMFPDGFYTNDNPNGLKPNTNLLIVKTGFYF